MSKKILIFSDEYPPSGGGAGVVAKQLVNDLIENQFEVSVISGDEKKEIQNNVFQHIEVQRTTLIWPFSYYLSLKRIDLNSFQTIILNDVTSAHIAGLFFQKKDLSNCIVIIHGEDSKFVYKNSTIKKTIFFLKAAYSRTLKYCNRAVAVSAYAQNIFMANLPEEFINLDISYQYAGLCDSKMPKPVSTLKSSVGIPEEAILFFSASRLVKEKGLMDQIEIFIDLLKKGNNYYWFIAGSGYLKNEIEEKIKRNKISDRVKILGKLDKKELANYYTMADIFWLLSYASYETFGLVYIEAAYYGTPSIGLKIGGVVESINEGISGIFYDGENIENAIKSCLSISRESCMAHAEKFTSKNFAKFLTN